MAQNDNKLKECFQLFKEGTKLAKGGIFSKKNPDDAEKKFEEARKKLRLLNPVTKEMTDLYLKIMDEMAECRYDMNLFLAAAQSMEEAAKWLEKEEGESSTGAADYYVKSSVYWRTNKQYEKACDALVKAAEIYGTKDFDKGMQSYDDALQIEEDEKRYKMCHVYFDKAVRFCISEEKYKNAIALLERQIVQYENETEFFIKRIMANIASIMVIYFHLKDVKSAQGTYYKAVEKYEAFLKKVGEQAFAEQLLKIFEKADEESLEIFKKSGDFGVYLTNTFSVLGKKLNMKDIKPLEIPLSSEQKEQEKQNLMKQQEAKVDKQDIPDYEQVIQSDVNDVKVDDTGAPNLFD